MSIEFTRLSKVHFQHHNQTMLLKGKIAPSSIVALQGISGCGKSTLLRSLAQVDESSVSYLMNSKDPSALSAAERKISLIFQKALLFPHLNVLQNLMFPMKFVAPWSSWSLALRAERALLLLKELSLENLAQSTSDTLSGGESMRISLLRSLICEPNFLLLDEPFSGLDKKTKDEVKSWLKMKIVSLRIPTLIVSHVDSDLLDFADTTLKWPSLESYYLNFASV